MVLDDDLWGTFSNTEQAKICFPLSNAKEES